MPPSGSPVISGLVDSELGVVSRETFVNEDIFKQEIARIFDRSWLFLGHESEIPAEGDFITRNLSTAPVVVSRGADGAVHAVLNSCRHRGVKVCRVDSGNAASFTCPYHGWRYQATGALLGSPFRDQLPAGIDFSAWGLVKVPKIGSYQGLIFGSWDADIAPLEEYLGQFRWYIDVFFGRTPQGMQVLGPPQRFRVRTNWKTAALNFGTDNQHVFTTHIGPFTLQQGQLSRPEMNKALAQGVQVASPAGHNVSITTSEVGGPFARFLPEMVPLYEATLKPDQQGLLSGLLIAVGSIFPHMSFIERNVVTAEGHSGTTTMIRLWQPLGVDETKIWSWSLADKETPAAFKERSLNDGVRNFGLAGVFEQEDVELWSGIGEGSRNPVARQYPFSFQTALPMLDSPVPDYPGPCPAYRPWVAEITQFKFMQHWARQLEKQQ
jgi:PAH dioxygenase large subunit